MTDKAVPPDEQIHDHPDQEYACTVHGTGPQVDQQVCRHGQKAGKRPQPFRQAGLFLQQGDEMHNGSTDPEPDHGIMQFKNIEELQDHQKDSCSSGNAGTEDVDLPRPFFAHKTHHVEGYDQHQQIADGSSVPELLVDIEIIQKQENRRKSVELPQTPQNGDRSYTEHHMLFTRRRRDKKDNDRQEQTRDHGECA